MVKNDKDKSEKGMPVVAILGHVDHGKTSILDYIRKTNVQLKEVGGITQKISAFTIEVPRSGYITFIDTPGHESFDLMRSRGGKVADIVLLIIAADDGIKPQTVESIEIIKNLSVKPVVVITKKDLGSANISKIKRDLSSRGLLVEGMGGNIPVVETSTKTGEGIDDLLEIINLTVEIEGLKKVEKLKKGVLGKCYILESIKDKSQGFVVSLVVTEGLLEVGKFFTYKVGEQVFVEKIKAFVTEDGDVMKQLYKGFGGKVIGVSSLVDLGVEAYCLVSKDEKLAKSLFVTEKKEEEVIKEEDASIDLELEEEKEIEDFFADVKIEDEELKSFKVIIKSSSEGSLEAIKQSLEKITVDGVKVDLLQEGIGNIGIRDVDTASITKAIILGFEVGMEKGVTELAKKKKVFIKTYDIIYKLIDDIKDAATMLVEPDEVEEEIGSAEIKAVFDMSDGSKVVGCKGKEGNIKRGFKAYVVREDDIIVEGKITSMKHNKNDIKEAGKNDEFGVILNVPVDDVVAGDILHCFKVLN